MHDNNDTGIALFKGLIMWFGVLLGSITLSKAVLFSTLVYTCLQTYVLVRDKIAKRKCDGL